MNDVDGLVGVIETIAETWQPGEKLVLSRPSLVSVSGTTEQFAPAQLLPWLQKLDSMTSFTEAAIKAFECHLAMILLVTLVRTLTLAQIQAHLDDSCFFRSAPSTFLLYEASWKD